jgi:nucleoside-diphosphate-sugar epimerase/glycosyltransferase involved in cell wall biosynthesis
MLNTTFSNIDALQGPIIVTGASGFVGANLFKTIRSRRDDVFAVVREKKGWRLKDVHDSQIIASDLNNSNYVKHLVESVKPKTVLDCVAYGAYSFEKDPDLIYETNFLSVVRMVEMLAQNELVAYVHAGSSSEYGKICAAPKESDQRDPNSHYAVSKSAVSDYLKFAGKNRSIPCINLRLYSVYGPLEDTSRLIPNLLRHAIDGKLPPFVDARISRDFIHIDDVCSAFISAAAHMNPEVYGESFNIGTGIKTTIADLAELTRTAFDVDAHPQFGVMEGRSWDLQDWYSNPQKANDMIGWTAKVGLKEGLKETAKWVSTLSDEEMLRSTKKNASGRKKSISAVIACYKDEPAIPIMYRRLTDVFLKLGVDYEIIFVNDCSPDATSKVIESISLGDPRVLGISHSRNFGSQMAFRSGMELCTKDSVVLLDGDLQDPPELIEEFYKKWEDGWDVVYGRRVKREMTFLRGLSYKAFYRVFSAFSYIEIPLDAGDFSLIDRRVMNWLLDCPERDLFLRGLRAYVGFKQTGVDYVRPERMFGITTNNLLKNLDWAKKGIFSFSNTPLTILTYSGVVALGMSLIAAFGIAMLKIFVPEIAPKGITTVLMATLIFGSFNLFAIGLVGEYVAKIMAEVKGRPRLIRAALIRHGKITELLADGKKQDIK